MNKNNKSELAGSSKTRGAAMRAQRHQSADAQDIIDQYGSASHLSSQPAPTLNSFSKLKVSFLGGLADVGEKNMAVIEYQNEAIIIDCGNNLGVELPGVNYEINDTTYLETIKHKLKAYVITHGHLDHMGGLKHTVPKYPAPIYASRFTIGIIKKAFDDEEFTSEDFEPELITVDLDSHNRLRVGSFWVEFIRVTHSLPDAAAVCIDTPVGRIIATGDFRLDPEPLDRMPSDTKRLQALGDEGVLLLLSDSSYADVEGRVPTESTLQQSFYDIINRAPGRIFVAAFSSNINRSQMIINAAVAAGRKVTLDGRGMLSYAEIAVRQGILKMPKDTIIPITQAGTTKNDKLLIMCTGGQGEPNAALQRMSQGKHRHVNLKAGDSVVISSSPIPGNEVSYDQISNRLSKIGVHLFRHPTHELDNCGPLHVSGHARRGELREMLQLTKPKFFIPVHGGALRRSYHGQLGIEEGIARQHVLLPSNGDSYYLTAESIEYGGQVPSGSQLVDQTGSVVAGIVAKDRLMLSRDGFVTVILTIDRKSGQLLTSPDIISRGFVAMTGNEDTMRALRSQLRRIASQCFGHSSLDSLKAEFRDFVIDFCFDLTGLSPMVIPVVNIIDGPAKTNTAHPNQVIIDKQRPRQAQL